ncbi:MAG: hypothetical protein GOV15_03010 [Candidatus Diapherotrites archaeon]|nr:hypothetical protein [Candidatus Diapherotrites archaeon]
MNLKQVGLVILIAVVVAGVAFLLLPKPSITSLSYVGEGVLAVEVENAYGEPLTPLFLVKLSKGSEVVFEGSELELISSVEDEDPVTVVPAKKVVSGFVGILNPKEPGEYVVELSLINGENEVFDSKSVVFSVG